MKTLGGCRRLWLMAPLALASSHLLACREEPKAPPLESLRPAPLPKLASTPAAPAHADPGASGASSIVELTPHGQAVPTGHARWLLQEGRIRVGDAVHTAEALAARVESGAKVLLVPDAETYLAQLSPLLAALDDARAEVWLAHPGGELAFPLRLRDEPSFQAWLDEPVPGRIRVVHLGDGFELMTNMGKLPGPDANGPSIPLRGGRQDLGRLQQGLEALHGRFGDADELCWVPTFGMELGRTAAALAAVYVAPGEAIFPVQCLVYPRPKPREAAPAAR